MKKFAVILFVAIAAFQIGGSIISGHTATENVARGISSRMAMVDQQAN